MFKNRHLRWRSHRDIFRPYSHEPHLISESLADARRPRLKFLPGPFKAMVRMAKLAGAKCLPLDVVLAVRRRQDNRARLGKLKQDTFKRRKTRWIQMLHNFYNAGGVEAFQPFIAIHERAVDQFNALALQRRKALITEALYGPLQGLHRDVHAENFLELLLLQKFTDQLALAAAGVEHTLGA